MLAVAGHLCQKELSPDVLLQPRRRSSRSLGLPLLSRLSCLHLLLGFLNALRLENVRSGQKTKKG